MGSSAAYSSEGFGHCQRGLATGNPNLVTENPFQISQKSRVSPALLDTGMTDDSTKLCGLRKTLTVITSWSYRKDKEGKPFYGK